MRVDLHFGTVGEIDRRAEDDLIARLDPVMNLNRGAKVACHRHLAKVDE